MFIYKSTYNFLLNEICDLKTRLDAAQKANSVLVERLLQKQGIAPAIVTEAQAQSEPLKVLDELDKMDLWEDEDEVRDDVRANKEATNDMMELQP